jgi:hypothetical protein
MTEAIRIRVNPGNRNHHLWKNNGTWFVHYTVHRADHTKARVRASLRTRRLSTARRLRDRVLHGIPAITAGAR